LFSDIPIEKENMKQQLLFCLGLIFLIVGCNSDNDPCESIGCPISAASIGLAFFDEESREDLFLNGTLDFNTVTITDLDTEDEVFFQISGDFDDDNLPDASFEELPLDTPIPIILFFEEDRPHNIQVSIESLTIFTLSFEVGAFESECCGTLLNLFNPSFDGVNFEETTFNRADFLILL